MEQQIAVILPIVSTFFATREIPAWLVGGAARDFAMGRMPHDLDIAVLEDSMTIARKLANKIHGSFVVLDEERGTGRVVCLRNPERKRDMLPPHQRLTVDVGRWRAPTLEGDLRLRDFTINALAVPIEIFRDQQIRPGFRPPMDAFIDACGGLSDLEARILRPCSPESLRNDPLRSMRAFRFAAELGFDVSPELDAALRDAAPLIKDVAGERIRDELLRLLTVPDASAWLHYMDDVGLLTSLFPDLEPSRLCSQPNVHFLPVLEHMLETVTCVEWLLEPLLPSSHLEKYPRKMRRLPVSVQTYPHLVRTMPRTNDLQELFTGHLGSGEHRTALFKLAALLHDIAKPRTMQIKPDGGVSYYGHPLYGARMAKAIAKKRLRLSRLATKYLSIVVYEHMRPGQLRDQHAKPRALARLFRDTEGAGPDVLLHALADHMAVRGPDINRWDWTGHVEWTGEVIDRYLNPPEDQVRALVSGRELMETLGLEPGKLIGDLLYDIREAQVAGDITTPEEAFDLARRMMLESDL